MAIAQDAGADGGHGSVGRCAGSFGKVCVIAQDPGSAGGTSGSTSPTAKGKPGKKAPDAPVCKVTKLDPQPPAGSSEWKGHKPGDGAIYIRSCVSGDNAIGITQDQTWSTFWAADEPPEVDPEVLARQALSKMTLAGPDIASPKADGTYVVGVPMWLWVNRSATAFGPLSASASAGAVTVTATAKVSKIVWRLGDGATLTCNGPGTPYTKASGGKESPTCGHRYMKTSAQAPGSKFQAAATSTWLVDWQVNGGGETGQFVEVRTSTVAVPVGELQAVGD
ncbi:ATP/GTP-binding protein [Streptomyces sp. NPDC001904]|uniref:ATP/GTP-binding protein n=1 Tax=Streptomyces sp. NPDC001904 TaxID=3154531 RepID=UPI003333BE03